MYSQTKQGIKYLRYILVFTHVKSNHANFQKFWPIDKGAESFEIRPPNVHSNFSVESNNQLHMALPKLENYDTLKFRLLSNIYVSYA